MKNTSAGSGQRRLSQSVHTAAVPPPHCPARRAREGKHPGAAAQTLQGRIQSGQIPSPGSCLGQSQDRGEAEPFLLRQRRAGGSGVTGDGAPCPAPPGTPITWAAHASSAPFCCYPPQNKHQQRAGSARAALSPGTAGIWGNETTRLRGGQGAAPSLLQAQTEPLRHAESLQIVIDNCH